MASLCGEGRSAVIGNDDESAKDDEGSELFAQLSDDAEDFLISDWRGRVNLNAFRRKVLQTTLPSKTNSLSESSIDRSKLFRFATDNLRYSRMRWARYPGLATSKHCLLVQHCN